MNLPIIMSSAEQKQSLPKDCNKQLQEIDYRPTESSERTNSLKNWLQINLGYIHFLLYILYKQEISREIILYN